MRKLRLLDYAKQNYSERNVRPDYVEQNYAGSNTEQNYVEQNYVEQNPIQPFLCCIPDQSQTATIMGRASDFGHTTEYAFLIASEVRYG